MNMKGIMSRYGPAVTGAFVGTAASLLVFFGNLDNMGICVACFTRDIAGALRLHRTGAVQCLRLEIPGFIPGAFLSAFFAKEDRPRAEFLPMVRFFLGFLAKGRVRRCFGRTRFMFQANR